METRKTRLDEKVVTGILDLFVAGTKTAIGLYESDREIFSSQSEDTLQPYCQLIARHPPLASLCVEDQRRRAEEARDNQLTVCHAGLHAYAWPVTMRGKHVATFLSGPVRMKDDARRKKATSQHHAFMTKIQVDSTTKQMLQELYSSVEEVNDGQLAGQILPQLKQTAGLYRVLLQEMERMREERENVAHEIILYVQAGIAETQKMLSEMRAARSRYETRTRSTFGSLRKLTYVATNYLEDLGPYAFELHPLDGVVRQSVELWEPEAAKHGVEFQVDMRPGRSPMIEMSRQHMLHAISNLISNAVKYSYFGDRKWRKRWIRIQGQGVYGWYQLTIENYGIGILPEELEAIWGRGYRGKLTRDEFRTGSGLGLDIVRRVVDGHHGRIRVTSEPQAPGGPYLTRFVMRLPFEQPG